MRRPDAQILDADLAQGEVEMAEHGVEERLRQRLAVGLAPQPIDHQRRMQGERIEAAIERVGNAAGLEQFGRTRPLGRAGIERRRRIPQRAVLRRNTIYSLLAAFVHG